MPLPSCVHVYMQSSAKEKLFKILVIGDKATGKTSIIKRYVHQRFSELYKTTVSCLYTIYIQNILCECLCVPVYDYMASPYVGVCKH